MPEGDEVEWCCDEQHALLRLQQRLGVDLADQSGQDLCLRGRQQPFEDRVGDQRQLAEQSGCSQPAARCCGAVAPDVGQPSSDGAGSAVIGGRPSSGPDAELPLRGADPSVEPVELGRHPGDLLSQLDHRRPLRRLRDERVDGCAQQRQGRLGCRRAVGCRARRHRDNLRPPYD